MTKFYYLILTITVLAALLYSFNLYFLRDPERYPPEENYIIAPADGRIIDILNIDADTDSIDIDKGLFGRIKTLTKDMGNTPFVLISIFMNPLNVHVQRIPISGKIINITHTDGGFRVTNTLKAIDNERTETLIQSSIGFVKVIQIAGFMVRRIENWLSENTSAVTGQRMGIIKFGSQVSILFPKNEKIQIKVKKGEKVKAGESILAEITK